MYYLKKSSSLGLMDKVRFTDKVRERLLIIHNADIIKTMPISYEVFLSQSIWFN